MYFMEKCSGVTVFPPEMSWNYQAQQNGNTQVKYMYFKSTVFEYLFIYEHENITFRNNVYKLVLCYTVTQF